MEFLRQLFVYGSLRRNCGNDSVLAPFPHEVQVARTKGLLYHVPQLGYSGLIEGEGEAVGELISFGEHLSPEKLQEIYAVLDAFEGYYGPGSPDNLYVRRVVSVWREPIAQPINAYAYFFADEARAKSLGELIPHGDWKRYLSEQEQRRRGSNS